MPKPYENESDVTVGELIEQLSSFAKDDPVCFGPHGHFTFYRVKDRGDIAQIEFNESPGADYDLLPSHHYMLYLKTIETDRG